MKHRRPEHHLKHFILPIEVIFSSKIPVLTLPYYPPALFFSPIHPPLPILYLYYNPSTSCFFCTLLKLGFHNHGGDKMLSFVLKFEFW